MLEAVRSWHPAWRYAGLAVLIIAAVAVALGGATMAYGDQLRDSDRLLPETTIAGVDVGGQQASDAADEVRDQLAPQGQRELTLTYDEQSWTVGADELGAEPQVEAAVDDALSRTDAAGFGQLLRSRLGSPEPAAHEVSWELDDDALTARLDAIAGEIERPAEPAELQWTDGAIAVAESTTGREVQRDQAAEAIASAIADGADEVALPVSSSEPDPTTAEAQQAADALQPAVEQAMGHAVTATLGERAWEVTPAQIGATPDLAAALPAALDGEAPERVELQVPDEGLQGRVAEIAAEIDQAARDAQLSVSGGDLQIGEAQTGRALAREEAAEALREALTTGGEQVELRAVTTQPSLTASEIDHVLVLRQSERRLYLYRGGEVVGEWPVAVGLAGTPTPKGQFTVGAKRYEPVWVNPSPNGWGSDMPAKIGPSPENPLGLRALNWMDGGRDTLIRFHGTPNEASIGEAASHGCVRMTNDDVIDLYDLVPSGTPILSVS